MADLAPAVAASPAYEDDAYGWALRQARLIRERRLDEIDVENVAEEIEGVARGEKRELKNRLAVLIRHLLKWQYQPDRRGRIWTDTIDEQRIQLEDVLEENPSLGPLLDGIMARAHRSAVRDAARETGLAKSTFPAVCPYSVSELMDEGFLPE